MKNLNKSSLKKYLQYSPIIIVVLLIVYSFKTHGNRNELEDEFFKEKKLLQKELDNIVLDYQEMTSKKRWLRKRVVNGMNKIIALKDSVAQMKKVNYDLLFKYSLKVTKLERENRKLFLKAASLRKENKQLQDENLAIKEELGKGEETYKSLVSKNKKLLKEERVLKHKVSLAGAIEIGPVSLESLKERRNGKYSSTSRSRKTDAFKVKFNLLPNEVTVPGNREIYVQLLDQNNNIVPSQKSTSKNDKEYNDLINVDYDNEKVGIVSLISVDRNYLSKGNYTVNVFIGDRKVGNTSISLR